MAAVVLAVGTTALAAAGLSRRSADNPPVDPAVLAAEQATRDIVDERVRAELRSLR